MSKVISSLSFALVLACTIPIASSRAVETADAVTISVENGSAKVGEKAVIVAKITPREGYKLAENYRNRVSTLSAEDQQVEFIDKPAVRGTVEDGSLVFKIKVIPKQPGDHAINGVMRFGFVNHLDGARHLDIKWAPLMATVTGTE